jgi:hypothetical protein
MRMGLETVLFTAMSVACEATLEMTGDDPEFEPIREKVQEAKREMDAFLEDRDRAHINRAEQIMQEGNTWLLEFKAKREAL